MSEAKPSVHARPEAERRDQNAGQDAPRSNLLAVFEHSPWVAQEALARGPFDGVDELHAAMVDAVRAAPRERQVELIRAHPELAGREALTPSSSREQRGAGLDRLSRAQFEALRTLNRDYREKFGFPLVVFVREHTPDSIIAWGRERLESSRDDEIETALGEIAKIARARLEEL
jgi:2-oxo-4-hydroxy-4-carboxy-5-ureidoimidazoline decarboxylase